MPGCTKKRWQVVPADEDAAAFSDLGDQAAVAAENPQRDLQRNIANCLGLGQSGRHIVISADNAGRDADAANCRDPEHNEQGANQLMSPIVTWTRFFFG